MAFAFAGALGDPPLLECFKVRFLYSGQQAGVGNGEAARRGGAFLLAETVGEAAFKRTKPSVACGRVKAAFGMESGNGAIHGRRDAGSAAVQRRKIVWGYDSFLHCNSKMNQYIIMNYIL